MEARAIVGCEWDEDSAQCATPLSFRDVCRAICLNLDIDFHLFLLYLLDVGYAVHPRAYEYHTLHDVSLADVELVDALYDASGDCVGYGLYLFLL